MLTNPIDHYTDLRNEALRIAKKAQEIGEHMNTSFGPEHHVTKLQWAYVQEKRDLAAKYELLLSAARKLLTED